MLLKINPIYLALEGILIHGSEEVCSTFLSLISCLLFISLTLKLYEIHYTESGVQKISDVYFHNAEHGIKTNERKSNPNE